MQLEQLGEQFLTWLLAILPKLLAAAAILVAGFFLSRFARKLCEKAMEKSSREVGVISFLGSAASVIVKIVAAIIALSALGVDTAVLVGGLSAISLGISLALKDNMANVASGLQMLVTKPFHVGDYIKTEDDVEGTVGRIELMFTTLRTFDNKQVIIPNARLANAVLIDYTAMDKRCLSLTFSVSYDDDLAYAKEVLRQTAVADKRVLVDPAPLVAVNRHGDSGVELMARLWCKTDDYWPLYYTLQEAVKLAFDAHGIHIPCTQVEVHLDRMPVPKER